MRETHIVKPGEKYDLDQVDPGFRGDFSSKRDSQRILEDSRSELIELQEKLYAQDKHSLLIVIQAIDTGGKDGTIRHVMRGVNPQGCQVVSFKAPTAEELSYDYLWRIHKAVPPRRMIGIFNRSHYEDVLIVRVRNLVPQEQWEKRYDQINQFEKHLSENGTTILKFYLHISKDEQQKRLQARLDDRQRWWKFDPRDIDERELWDKYQHAFEVMLNRTSTPWAPWFVIPANRKWYRNLAVAGIIIDTLRDLDVQFPEPKVDYSHIVIPD